MLSEIDTWPKNYLDIWVGHSKFAEFYDYNCNFHENMHLCIIFARNLRILVIFRLSLAATVQIHLLGSGFIIKGLRVTRKLLEIVTNTRKCHFRQESRVDEEVMSLF